MSIDIATSVTAPYPGLRPFQRDESLIFFGRDQQIDEVLVRLKSHRFLGIVGTSGCGKSSLVRAGMLPALESGLMGKVGSTWFVADMKPGDAPLTNLAKALIQSEVFGERWSGTPEGIALLTAALRKSDVALVNMIGQVELPPFTNLLVLVDQFEEIFRFQQQDPNEALTFVNLLLCTARDRSVPIYIVLTMRSDFLGQCSTFLGLPEALNDAQYLCPRLTRNQLAEVIEGPASLPEFGGEVEPKLVTQIINDAGANSDQLPLVQHVLARMWHLNFGNSFRTGAGQQERVLRLEDYLAVGGLKGVSPKREFSPSRGAVTGRNVANTSTQNALSQHADEAYFSLADGSSTYVDRSLAHQPSHKQMIAQVLFCCLAERAPSGQYVRRPIRVQEVAAVAGCSVPVVIEVVDVFRREDRSFLVPPVGVTLDGNSVIDISHEALIRQWQRFGSQSEQTGEKESTQSWLEIEDLSRRRYRRLAEAAENEKTAGLLRNPELGFLDQWWRRFRPTQAWANACVPSSFDRTESLLKRSLAQAADEEREKQADQQARIAAAEEYAKKMKRRSIAIAIVAVLAIIGFIQAMIASREAARQKSVAIEQRTKADEKAIAATNAQTAAEAARHDADAARLTAEKQKDRAERLAYSSVIASAQRAWETGNGRSAWEYLNSAQWNLRGWEHDYLLTRFNQSQSTHRGHAGGVSRVAFSLDGKRIVSGSADHTLKVWDAESGQETLTLEGHTRTVNSVAFSPDGKRIVSGSGDHTSKVWDATSGKETLTLKGHTDSVLSVAFSPDGKRIVSGSGDNTLKVWDATSGQATLTLKGHAGNVLSVAFSPDGKRIVSGSGDHTLKVWDAESGQETLTLKGHTWNVNSVAFSPDGKRILSGSSDMTLKVWDAESGMEKLTLKGHAESVNSVAFSPDGKRIVSGSDDTTLVVWDAESGSVPLTLTGHTDSVLSVAFSEDGKRIVSGSSDTTLKVWDVGSSKGTPTLGRHEGPVWSVAFSPDGKRIVSGSGDTTLKVWNEASGQETFILKGHTADVNSAAFSPDGKRIVSGSRDNTLKVWDAESGQETLTLKRHTGFVNSVAFSPDGKRIVSGSWDKTLKVWDAMSGRETLTLKWHAKDVSSVAFSPDGKRIVSGSGDQTLKVWDAESGLETLTLNGHTGPVHSVAFSPDGKRIVSGSWDKTLKVWDAESGQATLTLKGHTAEVYGVAFSPDGKRIVSGGRDTMLKVWDAMSGLETLTLKGHTSSVISVAFSLDGKRIVSGSYDNTLKVWDAMSGQKAKSSIEGTQLPDAIAKPTAEASRVQDAASYSEPAPSVESQSTSGHIHQKATSRTEPIPEVWGFSLSVLLFVGLIALLTLSARRP